MFKVGDRVVYKGDVKAVDVSLTKYKTYIVQKSEFSHKALEFFSLKDDSLKDVYLPMWNFILLKDYRKRKIVKILC